MPDLGRERRQLLRFVVVGGSNTAVTYLLFVLLSQLLDPRLAYTLVFALGVLYSVLLTGSFVFGAARRARTSLAYAGWYLVVYAVGLGVLHVLQVLGLHRPALLGLLVLTVTTPLNYLGGRVLFRPTPVPTREIAS